MRSRYSDNAISDVFTNVIYTVIIYIKSSYVLRFISRLVIMCLRLARPDLQATACL